MPAKEYQLSDFDFDLPPELLAEYPSEKRDSSRLMVISRSSGKITHHIFNEIGNFLSTGDLLVLNDTKVIPAKLEAQKHHPKNKGARIKVLLLSPTSGQVPGWNMLLDPMRKIEVGTRLTFKNGIVGQVDEIRSEKEARVIFPEVLNGEDLRESLFGIGKIPLPPYIKRDVTEADSTRYQTIYATNEGALAAPTAGLHFTEGLLHQLGDKGVDQAFLTLDIGMGTFNPIYKEDLNDVKMHRESYNIPLLTAEKINETRAPNKVLAVGTTTMRALESATNQDGIVHAGPSQSELFIKPGYTFNSQTALLTNFHTPKSSLLMMISAFMGYELTKEVYARAVEQKYRFFSYGDAMLILN